jgi:hypothetical protein
MDRGDLLVDSFNIFFVLALGTEIWFLLLFATLRGLDGFEDVVFDEYA